jgi:hypothetical protein
VRSPTLELLWWEGCPSTDRALAELRAALAELGLERIKVATREIRTDGDAAQARFAGSPTILIDGVDFTAPTGSEETGEETVGLNCRVYHRRDGRISPTPDPDDLREALRRAAEHAEVGP